MKFQKDGIIIDVNDPNTYNLFERNGFEPVEEAMGDAEPTEDTELEELRAKAKELGIRNAHSMKKETLIEKIQEQE